MPHPEQPSYEELAARNAELLAVVAEQSELIESLRAEVAALRRQAGRDSSNASQPPSQDGPAAEAKAKAGQRRARAGRAQGGQKGHPGASLAWAARPDETLAVESGTCGGCGADQAGAPGRVGAGVQVADIPPAALTVTEYQMMCRTCGCGQVTTAPPPPGVTGGPVCYGPGVVDAATLLASTDVIGVERAADLMGALLKAPVSTGFVSRCLVRLDAALIAAGFEDALKDALRAADALGTDETPAPLTTAATSQQDSGTVVLPSRTDHGQITEYDRRSVGGAESGYIQPDPDDPNISYVSNTYGTLTRFDKRTGQGQIITPWSAPAFGVEIAERKYRFPWTAPLVFSPVDHALYYGSQYVLKTGDLCL